MHPCTQDCGGPGKLGAPGLRNVVYDFCRQVRYAANVAGSHVSGSDPCRGKQEFPNHQQERSAFHAETCHTNCGDLASLGLSKSLLVNPRPLIRRTINELRWPSSVPIATASPPPLQPAPSVAAPEPTADTKVKASTDKGSKDLLRIPPEFSYTNSGLLIKLGHSTTSAELAKMLSSFRAQGSRRQQHRAWPIKILTLAHSHGFNAVLYALTGSGLVMAGVKWF